MSILISASSAPLYDLKDKQIPKEYERSHDINFDRILNLLVWKCLHLIKIEYISVSRISILQTLHSSQVERNEQLAL